MVKYLQSLLALYLVLTGQFSFLLSNEDSKAKIKPVLDGSR